MHILIQIGNNGTRRPSKVARYKFLLIEHLKENGYYYSKKVKRYVDDKTSGIDGGSGTDYIIEQIEEIT